MDGQTVENNYIISAFSSKSADIKIQEHLLSVKRFGSKSGPTFQTVCIGYQQITVRSKAMILLL